MGLVIVIVSVTLLFCIGNFIDEYQRRGIEINSMQSKISELMGNADTMQNELKKIIISMRQKYEQELKTKEDISTDDKRRLIISIDNLKNSLFNVHLENDSLSKENEVLKKTLDELKETIISMTQKYERELKIKEDMNICNKRELMIGLDNLKNDLFRVQSENDDLKNESKILKATLHEAPLGFPTLLSALALYDFKKDESLARWLETKQRPAYTSAQIVREETRKRREAEYESRQSKALLEYYCGVNEYEDEELPNSTAMIEAPAEDDEEDISKRYLSNEEYRSLSTAERNQLALNRFWDRDKSKLAIGRLYEQYIGYLYEKSGWIVEYYGISEGLSDLGRDLICHKDMTTLLVQCKNWSKYKKIYEKHIFQLFGTTYEYYKNHPFEKVRGVFYTSTKLSDVARGFARDFHIEIHEDFKLNRFPIIKCNIGKEGERIYHLPFDQQYYRTKIIRKDGDFYCETVAEAEAKGFRRAYRWRGNNY